MSELDPVHDALERLEWVDAKAQEETPVTRWRAMTRRTALTGGAAGIAAAMLDGVRVEQDRHVQGDGHRGAPRAGATSSPRTPSSSSCSSTT